MKKNRAEMCGPGFLTSRGLLPPYSREDLENAHEELVLSPPAPKEFSEDEACKMPLAGHVERLPATIDVLEDAARYSVLNSTGMDIG